MPVYFVYRCPYDNPGGRHVRRFDADTVLAWFRSVWKPIPPSDASRDDDPAWRHARELVGQNVYSFPSLFTHIHEDGWPPPATMRDLAGKLESAMYTNEVRHGPHHVQILTDDDELDMAVYVFDGHYAAKHPDRVALLTREDWRLPDGAADGGFRPRSMAARMAPKGRWAGATYFAFTYHADASSLEDLLECRDCLKRFDGVRLPDLPRYLLTAPRDGAWEESELAALRGGLGEFVESATGDEGAFLKGVAAAPRDAAVWSAYSDWLEEHDRPPAGRHLLGRALEGAARIMRAGDPGTRDEAHVGDHAAAACVHYRCNRFNGSDDFRHLILFDDLWAAAHPDLAHGILRFASRWDVL